jgi:hypothetical protein
LAGDHAPGGVGKLRATAFDDGLGDAGAPDNPEINLHSIAAMLINLRPCLTVLGILALALAMTLTWGFFSSEALAAALIAWALLLVACSLRDWQWQLPPLLGRSIASHFSFSFSTMLLATAALVLSGLGIDCAELWTPPSESLLLALRIPAGIGFAVLASLAIPFGGSRGRWIWVWVLLLFLAGAALRVGAIVLVPNPIIDVYVVIRDAPDHLWHGQNPYTSPYENPYDVPLHDYDALPAYPPLPFLLALPFRVAGIDVRYANVVCDLAAAAFLFGIAWNRGASLLGALAAGTYLFFPRAPFQIEQAWYEPMLAALLGGGWWLLARGSRLGYVLLGLGLTGKQYGVALLPPLAKALWPHRVALLAGLGIAIAIVILPFYLWDPGAFLDVILFRQLRRPVMESGLTLLNGAQRLLGLSLPPVVMTGLALVVIGWITWRTPMKTAGAGLWLGTALLTFCLCHVQGYFNYYYLCQYLLLVGLVGLGTEKPTGQGMPL